MSAEIGYIVGQRVRCGPQQVEQCLLLAALRREVAWNTNKFHDADDGDEVRKLVISGERHDIHTGKKVAKHY